MKKKKILIDARCIGGEGQGMLTYIVGLYSALKENYGLHYELFFAGYDFEALQSYFPWLEKSNFILLETKSKWSLFSKAFPKIIKKLHIEYAHFQYVTPFVKNCKHIVTTHDVLFLDFPEEFSLAYRLKRKLLFFYALLRSDIRLTVSDYSRQKIARHFKLSARSIAITPNAVNDKFLMPYDKSAAQKAVKNKFGIEKYILYVSRIEKRKNHRQLLDAYVDLQLADQGYHLVLVGNDTLGESSIATAIAACQKAYPGQVHWLKQVSESDLIQIYQAANLFVYPSKAEGFGIPPIEAAALGINTLCANNTAMQDFSFFENNLYDSNSPDNFIHQLKKNLQNPPLPDHLKNIAHYIKQHYSWETAASVLHSEIGKGL